MVPVETPVPSRGDRRRLRWWPAAAILLVTLAGLLWIWTAPAPQRQSQVLITGATLSVSALSMFVWWLLFSRLRWRTRLSGVVWLAALVAILSATFRVSGVSGDLIPQLDWRFGRSATPEVVSAGSEPAPGHDAIADYPQFLGRYRNGTVEAVRLDPDWEGRPPQELWRRPVGAAWSGFAVADGIAVTQEQRGEVEHTTAFDLATGEELWTHGTAARFEEAISGPGPRATPTIHAGRVYTLGAAGAVQALELADGRLVWQRDLVDDHEASPPYYGYSGSPLVVDSNLVVGAGGSGASLVAYDLESGELRWAAGDDPAAYGSPVLHDLAGARQIVWLNQEHVTGQSADDGAVLWRYPWPQGTEKVSQPIVLPGDRLFVSSGYGVGGKMLELRADLTGAISVELLWEGLGLKSKLSNIVEHEGYLYGLDDGILVCLDPSDGSRCWKRGRYGHGQMLLVGRHLLILAENGEIAMVEPVPDEHRELARMSVLTRKTWNHPALAGPYLLVRNDREAVCLKLPEL